MKVSVCIGKEKLATKLQIPRNVSNLNSELCDQIKKKFIYQLVF